MLKLLLASLLLATTLIVAAPASAAEPAGPTQAVAAPVQAGTWLFLPRGNRLLAASLSLGLNGAGQLYNGESEKGLGMLTGWLAFTAAWGVDELAGTGYLRAFAFAANVGIKAWSVADAWQQAASTPPAAAPSAAPAKP